MKHSFINWIWIDFRAPKFEKTPKASSKGLSVSVHWKLEFWRIVLHNSISKLQETHNFRKTSVMKPPARVNIWYLSLNLIIFSNWNRKKRLCMAFLAKATFFVAVQKPTNPCCFGRFWIIFSRGNFSGRTRSSPRQRSCYFTYKIFDSGHSSAQCLGGCLWGIWGGGR